MIRFTGPASALSEADRRALLDRSSEGSSAAVREATARILDRVHAGGDAALLALARELDGVALEAVEVPRATWQRAQAELPGHLRSALEHAAANIERAHRAFLPAASEVEVEPGVVVGRRPEPLGRVGVYAPGGRAVYPSSVLMGAVPARVAGVKEIVLCSPPGRTGLPSSMVLAAAELARVDRVFALGGAGAIGAMAFGTASVPRVDRIVGPGNAYVAEAKIQVSGQVGIDLPAGPSELLAIADASASPDAVARELLAQAEHDPQAAVVALGIGAVVAQDIEAALARALPSQERGEIVRSSLASRGAVLSVDSLDEAVALSNAFAPEHLLLAVVGAERLLERIRCAGTVFLGETSSVAFGDYLTGSNHVLPTGGAARTWSGLSVHDFLRWTSYQRVDRAAAARLASDCESLARAEGLPAHAAAAAAWRTP